MEFFGDSVGFRELMSLNKDLKKFRGNAKKFINHNGKLYLTNLATSPRYPEEKHNRQR